MIKFFLLLGRAIGDIFTVRDGNSHTVGDVIPVYQTNPNCKNSKARPVARARCVEDCSTNPRYTAQPYSDPRRATPLPKVNAREGAYKFRIEE